MVEDLDTHLVSFICKVMIKMLKAKSIDAQLFGSYYQMWLHFWNSIVGAIWNVAWGDVTPDQVQTEKQPFLQLLHLE